MKWTDLDHLPPIAGGSVDASEVPTGDAGGSGDAVPPESGEADTVEIDGERYAYDDIRAALDSHANRNQWETALKQREMREAAGRRVVEAAFNKRFHELDDRDLADLTGFGSINQRLRSDPVFHKAWVESLTQIYKQAGVEPAQARAAAERKAEQVKSGGEPPATGPTWDPRIGDRIARLEEAEINRGLMVFADRMDSAIKTAVARVAPEMKSLHPHLQRVVLNQLTGYDDRELMEMEESGQLNRLIWQVARQASAGTKAQIDAALKADAAAAANAGKGSPVPLKGGVTTRPAMEEFVPVRGRGIKDMHERLRREFVVPSPQE